MNFANFNLDDQDGLVIPNGEGLSRNQRPALGLKRTRFSLKPESSQTSHCINTNFSTDGIDDLEEYFSVCEHLNGMIKPKQDISLDFLLDQKFLEDRKPRLGIPRRSAKYKHIFADHDTSEDIVTMTEVSNRRNYSLPEDAYVKNHFRPPNGLLNDSQPRETDIDEIPAMDPGEGSITHDEKKIHNLFYNLSCDEDLDGDKIQAVLKNLHTKPIDLGKALLPGLLYSQKGRVGGSVPAMADVEISNLTAMRSPVFKSSTDLGPLTSTWKSKKRISLRDSLEVLSNQSSSPEEVDFEERSNLASKRQSPIQISDRNVNDASTSGEPPEHILFGDMVQKEFPTHSMVDTPSQRKSPKNRAHDEYIVSPAVDDNIASNLMAIYGSPRARTTRNSSIEKIVAGNMVLSNKLTMHSTSSLEKGVACEPGRFNDNICQSVGLNGSIENVGNDLQQNTSRQIHLGLHVSLEELVDSVEHAAVVSPQEKHNCLEYHGENDGVQVEDGSNGEEGVVDISNTSERTLPIDSLENTCISLEANKGLQSASETLPKGRKTSMPTRKNLRNKDSDSDKHIRAKMELPSHTGRRDLKSISRRESLAGAGTNMCAGVRRSTRIKSRPLEEWRGERFLYGRIHDSLTTVIGIKYCSPGETNFKVKSFVSEEYAALVTQAGKG